MYFRMFHTVFVLTLLVANCRSSSPDPWDDDPTKYNKPKNPDPWGDLNEHTPTVNHLNNKKPTGRPLSHNTFSESKSEGDYFFKRLLNLLTLEEIQLHAVAVLMATWCAYLIYQTKWSSFFTTRKICIIFFAIVYGWETMIAIKEVEVKYHEEFLESIASCTWLFWEVECKPFRAAASHHLYYMHPLRIVGNLTSRLIYSPASYLVAGMLSFTRHLSDQLYYGFRTPVYITLNLFLLYMATAIVVALIRNLVFNTPVSVKFLFFELNFKQFKDMPDKHHTTPSTRNQSEMIDSLSGDNLKNFLKTTLEAVNPMQNNRKKLMRSNKGGNSSKKKMLQ